MESSKNKPLFFAGPDSKKGQRETKIALVSRWVFTVCRRRFLCLQTLTNPAKSRGLLFDVHKQQQEISGSPSGLPV
jgi:hypothetical protein